MITPTDITNFSRTASELQEFFIFALFCAGKNSDYASECLDRILSQKTETSLFEWFKTLEENEIRDVLVEARIGQYNRLTKAIMQAANLDLNKCSLEDLTDIYGVGPKTARFFLLHTRKNYTCAVLDTHILKFLRDNQVDAPKNTPTNLTKYKNLEQQFIDIATKKFPSMTLADIDLNLWMEYSGRFSEK